MSKKILDAFKNPKEFDCRINVTLKPHTGYADYIKDTDENTEEEKGGVAND